MVFTESCVFAILVARPGNRSVLSLCMAFLSVCFSAFVVVLLGDFDATLLAFRANVEKLREMLENKRYEERKK